MSNEMETPINAALNMSELMQETNLNAEQREYVATVHDAGNGLPAIGNEILDFSKMEAGHLTLESVLFDPRRVIASVGKVYRQGAKSKGLTIHAAIDSRVPSAMMGDPVRLQQILANLIGNAIKFTSTGRIEISLGMDEAPARSDKHVRLIFSVTDTGVGIDADTQEALFHLFTQADSSVTRKFGGTGIGLVICKGLVTLMHGKIRIASTPGKGSRFTFDIECGVAEPVIGQVLAVHGTACVAAKAPPPRDLAGVNILLVEDGEANRRLAEILLKKLGCEVACAVNGLEAIEALQNGAYDLVLMDCMMPEMDGYEATRRYRMFESAQGVSRLPIIALTASATIEYEERCLEAGMDDYLAKPYTADALYRVIRQWLNAGKQ